MVDNELFGSARSEIGVGTRPEVSIFEDTNDEELTPEEYIQVLFTAIKNVLGPYGQYALLKELQSPRPEPPPSPSSMQPSNSILPSQMMNQLRQAQTTAQRSTQGANQPAQPTQPPQNQSQPPNEANQGAF